MSTKTFKMPAHQLYECSGACSLHPLLTPENAEILFWENHPIRAKWGDLFWADLEAQELALETPAARAARAAVEAERVLTIQRMNMLSVVEKNGLLNGTLYAVKPGRKVCVAKAPQPCKKLYSCVEGARCGAEPTTLHVSSDCWGHSGFTDPATGKHVAGKGCKWLHPGEDGWLPQWNTNRLFKPATAADRMAALAPSAAPRQSRFADMAGGGSAPRVERSAW